MEKKKKRPNITKMKPNTKLTILLVEHEEFRQLIINHYQSNLAIIEHLFSKFNTVFFQTQLFKVEIKHTPIKITDYAAISQNGYIAIWNKIMVMTSRFFFNRTQGHSIYKNKIILGKKYVFTNINSSIRYHG